MQSEMQAKAKGIFKKVGSFVCSSGIGCKWWIGIASPGRICSNLKKAAAAKDRKSFHECVGKFRIRLPVNFLKMLGMRNLPE